MTDHPTPDAEAADLAVKATDSIVDHIALAAAEHDLPDRIMIAALLAASGRLASALLGPEAAARSFRETAAQIERHGALAQRLETEPPAGSA